MSKSSESAADSLVFTASNDAMFALFMNLCGQYSIRKPSKFLTSLMPPDENKEVDEEDSTEKEEVAAATASQLIHQLSGNESDIVKNSAVSKDPKVKLPASRKVAKFSELKTIIFSNTTILGNSGLCCLLELIRESPYFESLDLSPLPNIFAHDSMKSGVSGNDVVEMLADVISTHPSLASVNLNGHAVGSAAISCLIKALEKNANFCRLFYDDSHVEKKLKERCQRVLEKNNNGINFKMPSFPREPSERMKKLQQIDRKTSREQQELHLLLYENKNSFGGIMSTEEMNEMVLNTQVMQLGEVMNFCRGLRGDEENMFLIASGCVEAVTGTQTAILSRGDYFGEPLSSAMYTAGRIYVKERGHCYRIPHRYLTRVSQAWDTRVNELVPLLKPVAILQSLPLWVIFRLCHDAKYHTYLPGETVISKSQPFAGLYIIAQGKFVVDAEARASLGAQRRELRESGIDKDVAEASGSRLQRGNSVIAEGFGATTAGDNPYTEGTDVAALRHQLETEESSIRYFSLTAGDFFGEEGAVSKHNSSTVEIKAAGKKTDEPQSPTSQAAAIQLDPGTVTRHVISTLKPALRIQTKQYSSHDMYIKKW